MKRVIERASSLKLTVEGWGVSLPFLESQLYFTGALPGIGVKEPIFHCSPGDSSPPSDTRLLDCWSPNTRSMLRSLTPNLFKKCAFYMFDKQGFVKNVRAVANLFSKKQYPNSWWKLCFMAKCAAVDLSTEARIAMATVLKS